MDSRPVPVRADGWRPEDPIVDGVIRRCLDTAGDSAARDGTREHVAGAMVLGVLAVAILVVTGSAAAAVLVPGLLAAFGVLYLLTTVTPAPADHRNVLAPIGGPGRLPAGYLVHPTAWRAGLAEHVATLPEAQLQAAAELCRLFPGNVDDLLVFTGSIAVHVPAPPRPTPAEVARRTRELVRVGLPILREDAARHPAAASAARRRGTGRA